MWLNSYFSSNYCHCISKTSFSNIIFFRAPCIFFSYSLYVEQFWRLAYPWMSENKAGSIWNKKLWSFLDQNTSPWFWFYTNKFRLLLIFDSIYNHKYLMMWLKYYIKFGSILYYIGASLSVLHIQELRKCLSILPILRLQYMCTIPFY